MVLHSDGKNADAPKTIKKRVEIIMNCSCISCETVQNKDCELTDQNTAELPTDLFNILHPNFGGVGVDGVVQHAEDVPDLIHFPERNRSGLNGVDVNFTNEESNEKLIKLLRSMEEQEGDTNINYDKRLIRELLEILENNREELGKENLMLFVDFVNMHNSENMQVDLSKLKEVLHKFGKRKDLEKHRSFGLGPKSDGDLEDLAKRYNLPGDYGPEGHPTGSAIGHRHFAGEEQRVGSETGHLVAGPHGSLVLAPDSLTPNHEGVVISYENHPKGPRIVADRLSDEE